MADSRQAGAQGTGVPGPALSMPEYRKEQAKLREMIDRQRQITKRLAALEESILQKETAYLESAPNGNIVTGYDNYIKGMTGAAAQRRKLGATEQNRVFSRSSVSYRPIQGDVSTPGSIGSTPASHAPTPLSASFKDGGANHSTPTSATAGKLGKKKNGKNNDDDGEDSGHGNTKKRTAFGAGRKG